MAMPAAASKLLLQKPKVAAPLDPTFAPLILGKRAYLKAAEGCKDTLDWALPRADGCARYSLPVFPEDSEDAQASIYLAGVLIQEMMWQRSGSELILAGPKGICEAIKKEFSDGGAYDFEIKSMPNVCGTPDKPFKATIADSVADLPASKDTPQVCGKDASGCRLAFDLGKSDIKTVAVKDNEVLSSKETEWDVTNPDPQYHYDLIVKCMKDMTKKLDGPIVAIGGSATGTVSADSEATWCDCFPNVPPDVYQKRVVPIFNDIAKNEFGGVPIKVINDGEVTAVAGGQMIGKGSLFGISLGSSEGSGYVYEDGSLTGWINENAYCPCDLNPEGPGNVWSPHRGDAAMYLGQRAATRLAAKGGVKLPAEYMPDHPNMLQTQHAPHAQCLKLVQAAMKDPKQEPQARKIYESIGVYMGYTIAQYCEYLDIKRVLILGRVTSGTGGDVMMEMAKKVLDVDFPHLSNITFHTPTEHMKRVGQCIAAAALPEL
mmetsp:Transcript_13318/g.39682  ORF Transcript_13318/g.39682 Transcript_13318/m.39682 type:complete len:488 (+) Transcript_13318:87-1550(+)